MDDTLLTRLRDAAAVTSHTNAQLHLEAAEAIEQLTASGNTRESALPLTYHDYRLELIQDADGRWRVMLPVDGYYSRREDAEAVLGDVWADALLDARNILTSEYETCRGQ